MTEWTPTVDALDGINDLSVATQPIPRLVRRSALRPSASRRELYADAREQGRLARGRNAFVWRGRLLPIGVPLAVAAGALTWRRGRSARETVAAVAAIGVASYLEARVEWSLRRRAYWRRRGDD
jgi:hypothetical protein